MDIKDYTISRRNPSFSAMAQAGIDVMPSQAGEAGPVYAELFRLLGGEGDCPPIVKSIKGNGYLPKVYQTGGTPTLQWGNVQLDLSEAFAGVSKVTVELTEYDTGFKEPHVLFSFDREEQGEIALIALPIGVLRDTMTTRFLTAAKRDLVGTFKTQVMPARKGVGLPDLSTVLGQDADVDVIVVGTVRMGPDWIKAIVEFDGQQYVCGTTGKAATNLSAPILKDTYRIPAKVRFFKKNFNVYSAQVGREHLNLD